MTPNSMLLQSPSPAHQVRKVVSSFHLHKFSPVDPEAIYIRLWSLEKEIKRVEPDMYFRIKEFTLEESDAGVSYLDISRFAEEVTHSIYRKKKISQEYLKYGEVAMQELVEELCFNIMYTKLFGSDVEGEEEASIKMQEKIFILQNLVTPAMIGIKDEHYSYNIFQLAFTGRPCLQKSLRRSIR